MIFWYIFWLSNRKYKLITLLYCIVDNLVKKVEHQIFILVKNSFHPYWLKLDNWWLIYWCESKSDIKFESMHHSGNYSPNEKKEASKHSSCNGLIVNPTIEHMSEELTPETNVIYLYVNYHKNSHEVHQNENSQRVQTQPFERSCQILHYLSGWRQVGRQHVDK